MTRADLLEKLLARVDEVETLQRRLNERQTSTFSDVQDKHVRARIERKTHNINELRKRIHELEQSERLRRMINGIGNLPPTPLSALPIVELANVNATIEKEQQLITLMSARREKLLLERTKVEEEVVRLIKQRYRSLAIQYHPDRQTDGDVVNAINLFQKLANAYQSTTTSHT